MDAHQNQVQQDTEKLKEIPKWARRYTKNRTLPFLISMIIFLFLWAAISIPSYFGGKAYKSGNLVLFWICLFVLAIAMISLAFFSVPKWGGKFIQRISRRLYYEEGDVSISTPEPMKKAKWLGYLNAGIFACCVLGSVFLGNKGYLSIEYMQPFSALYFVPFTVFLYLWQRPAISPLALLWPILYALHAILVVAGVPIQFSKPWIGLNMLIPTAGYGILCGLIGHIYSRYALKKLKTAAHLKGDTANET